MHRCVTVMYYRLFYNLEYQNQLNPDSDIHQYAIHYVYLPRINRSLKVFQECWNYLGVRTEHNMSPHQLFTAEALQLQRRGLHALDFFEQVDEMYGVDEQFDDVSVEDDYTVHVTPNHFEHSAEQMSELHHLVDPLVHSSNYGIELYQQTLAFIHSMHSSSL